MLSTWPVNSRPPMRVDARRARAARAASLRSCVSLKFAVTHTSSSSTSAISGCPGATIWPTSTVLRLMTPSVRRARSRVRGSVAPARAIASACFTRAAATFACARVACHLLGRRLRVRREACACDAPARAWRARDSATEIAVCASRDRCPRRICRRLRASAAATAASYCCCEISSFAISAFRRSTSRPARGGFGLPLAHGRLRRGEPRARRGDLRAPSWRCRPVPARHRRARW